MTTTAIKTRYEILTGPKHHDGTRPWMALASTVTVNAKTLGARCSYEAETTDPAALESALDADDDVIEYGVANG